MAEPGRPRRGPSRFLAPLALAATILGVYLIVSAYERNDSGTTAGGSPAAPHRGGSGSHGAAHHKRTAAHGHTHGGGHRGHAGSPAGASTGGAPGATATTTGTATSATTTTGTSTTGGGAKFYTVQPGDTMGIISVKTHVPLATIEQLNPGVSSNAMSVGQRLRIRK